MNLKGMKMYGISDFVVERVSGLTGKSVKISALLNIPKARSDANYVLDWKLGILNIKGHGKSYAVYGDIPNIQWLIFFH